MQKKEDPKPIKEHKADADKLMADLTKLAADKERDLFDVQAVEIIEREYSELIELYEVWLEQERAKSTCKPKKETGFAGVYKRDKDDKEEVMPVITKADGTVDQDKFKSLEAEIK